MIFAIISRLDLTDIVEPFDRNLTRGTTQQSLGSIQVSKLPTHSSSKPTFCPKGEVSFNVILGGGGGGRRAVSQKPILIPKFYTGRLRPEIQPLILLYHLWYNFL